MGRFYHNSKSKRSTPLTLNLFDLLDRTHVSSDSPFRSLSRVYRVEVRKHGDLQWTRDKVTRSKDPPVQISELRREEGIRGSSFRKDWSSEPTKISVHQ